MTLAERLAREAAPCTMAQYRDGHATVSHLQRFGTDCSTEPDGIRCCGCALRVEVQCAIERAIEACANSVGGFKRLTIGGDQETANEVILRLLLTDEEEKP